MRVGLIVTVARREGLETQELLDDRFERRRAGGYDTNVELETSNG